MVKIADEDLVVLQHPHGTLRIPFREWKARGPGPRYHLAPEKVVLLSSSREVSANVLPLRYRNSLTSRLLIKLGLLEDPWPENLKS